MSIIRNTDFARTQSIKDIHSRFLRCLLVISLAPTLRCSTRRVTVLTPERMTGGRFVTSSFLPAARASARAFSRCFFCSFVSGRYLSSRRKACVAANRLLYQRFQE